MTEQHNTKADSSRLKSKKIWSTAAVLLVLVLLSGIIMINIGFSSSQNPISDTLICITQDSALAQNNGSLTSANISHSVTDEVDITEGSNIWSTKAQVDIFKHNDNAVKSDGTGTANNVVAPGTANDYTFSLQNSKDYDIKYTLNITGGNDSVYDIPIQLQILDNTGEIISGRGWTNLADFTEANDLGTISPNNEEQYTIKWKWDFESGADDYDTYLGDTAVNEEIPCHINISVISEYDIPKESDSDSDKDSDTSSKTTSSQITSSSTSSSTPISNIIDLVTTSDRRNVGFIIGLFVVCAVTMIILVLVKKKSKDD